MPLANITSVHRTALAAACAGIGLALLWHLYQQRSSSNDSGSSSSSSSRPAAITTTHDPFYGSGASPLLPKSTVADHEKVGLREKINELREVGDKMRPILFPNGKGIVKATLLKDDNAHFVPLAVSDDNSSSSASSVYCRKKIHLIRHGEGHHNVAQKKWRQEKRKGEPYWASVDVDGVYLDAELTEEGESEARELIPRVNRIDPTSLRLLIVSPLRRATKTGLIAFSGRLLGGGGGEDKDKERSPPPLKVLANDLAHEKGGLHTCDCRLSKSELQKRFSPPVDYQLVESEEDPLWNEEVRETYDDMARRGLEFLNFLRSRDESHIAVSTHSAFLAVLLNAVLEIESREDSSWFATGEMRTFVLEWYS